MLSMMQPDTAIATFVAPSGGVTADVPLLIGSMVVVPITSAAVGEEFAAHTRGVFKLPKVSAVAMTIGHWVKWDVSEAECVLNRTAAGDFNLGRVSKAASADDTHVEVLIDNALRRSVNLPLAMADVAAVADSATGAAPFAGRVTRTWSQLLAGAIDGDAIITPKINGVAITGGALNLTAAGSAAGDIDTAYPTAANVVAAGDALVGSSNGGGSTTRAVNLYLEIEEL